VSKVFKQSINIMGKSIEVGGFCCHNARNLTLGGCHGQEQENQQVDAPLVSNAA
jgi:hypothetical protein